MKKLFFIGFVAFTLTLSFIVVASAQGGPGRGMKWSGSGGWGPGTAYQRLYNPSTVETVTGTIESVNIITPMKGMSGGVHLLLRTEKETVPVHLGPAWYIERLDAKLEKGDRIEVTGSRTTFDGKPAIIASQIKKGDNTLVLRDSSGIPAWAGWRR